MKLFDKSIYSAISFVRNKKTLNILNNVAGINDFNMIIPNLYLGNINCASNKDFLSKYNIESIINCTENEPFDEYFEYKPKFRLSVKDNKEPENIEKFKNEIIDCINFIDNYLEEDKAVYIHCYYGLLRSATVVAGYLIKKYNITHEEAIRIVREQRPYSMVSLYNFNEVLKHVEQLYLEQKP
jgi:protein tyrosine/serine phosphatase